MATMANRIRRIAGFLLPVLAGAALFVVFAVFVLFNAMAWIATIPLWAKLSALGCSLAAVMLLLCYGTDTLDDLPARKKTRKTAACG